MEIMNQGDEYKEGETEILEETKPKVNKKLIIIAVSIVVVGLGIVAAFTGGDKSGETPTDIIEGMDGNDWFTDIEGNPLDDPFTMDYTLEDISILRSYGYTAEEIEQHQDNLTDVSYLIEEAKASMEKRVQELYVELSEKASNPKSAEFKQLMNMTWLQGKPRVVATNADTFEITTYKENCRFTKVPARGPQLFIKLDLDSTGESVFLNVTPHRYAALKSEGQMVITYDLVAYGDQNYITNLVEVEI